MTEDDMFAKFEEQFDEVDTSTIVDFTKLSDLEVSTLFSDVRTELIKTDEMLHPTTDEGRRLHSERLALLIEMRKRGMS